MSDESDPDRTRGDGGAGLARRTWVRTAANAAWSVPLVSVATAAPSHAAVSTSDALQIDPATTSFYLWKFGPYWVLNPNITVKNPTTRDAGSVSVTLAFSTNDFVGINHDKPRTPSYVGLPVPSTPSDSTWKVTTLTTKPDDTVVSMRLTRAMGLPAGKSTTVGVFDKALQFGPVFANNPTVTEVPISVATTSTGFSVTAGMMSKINPPS